MTSAESYWKLCKAKTTGLMQCFKYEWTYELFEICKGTFLSEDTDVFVIISNRRTFFFPETENLNFGDF